MLIRVVLFLGIGLVLAAFGAAGWQYWQSLPAASDVEIVEMPAEDAAPDDPAAPPEEVAAAPEPDVAEPGQVWLISQGGGLVPRDDARAFLQQGKFVRQREVSMSLRLPLLALLSEGEGLPGDAYLEAFAEVRAGVAGARLCAPLLAAWAQGCAVHAASLRDDSYDPATQTAEFDVSAVFTLKPETAPLPDLSARTFTTDRLNVDAEDVGAAAASPEAYLAEAGPPRARLAPPSRLQATPAGCWACRWAGDRRKRPRPRSALASWALCRRASTPRRRCSDRKARRPPGLTRQGKRAHAPNMCCLHGSCQSQGEARFALRRTADALRNRRLLRPCGQLPVLSDQRPGRPF